MKILQDHRLLYLLGPVVACWWCWVWYLGQLRSNPDALQGLVPFACLILLAVHHRRSPTGEAPSIAVLIIAATCTMIAGISWVYTTPMIASIFAFSAFFVILFAVYTNGNVPAIGIFGLVLLMLPSADAVQFYFGYPLRGFVASLAATLLNLNGMGVTSLGTMLQRGEFIVSVDVACSGLSMLWSGALLTSLLICGFRLPPVSAALLSVLAVIGLLLANAFRVASLFLVAQSSIQWPTWTHSAVGLVLFTLLTGFLIVVASILHRRRSLQ